MAKNNLSRGCLSGTTSAKSVSRWRMSRGSRKHKLSFDAYGYLKALSYDPLETGQEDIRHISEVPLKHKEVAFVITNMESSTAQSLANEKAFNELSNIHDKIIRCTYEAYNGYEICMEGDSFQLAFSSTVSALCFCLEVQKKLLIQQWSSQILRLPKCSLKYDAHGKASFNGPRVRMAIHWARESLFSRRVHQVTRHIIFEGPALNVAKELCGAAYGGQILLSHEAWVDFNCKFLQAGFPTIEQLGFYKLENWPEERPIYNVTQRIGDRISRGFPPLEGLQLISNGAGLHIMPLPLPDENRMLTFVALKSEPRLDLMPNSMQKMLMAIISQHAQHFMGHLFLANREEGTLMLAFTSPKDALKYCQILQLSLLFEKWPSEHLALCPKTIPGPSSVIPLFHGPRVSAIVHTTKYHSTMKTSEISNLESISSNFNSSVLTYVSHLSAVAHPGQIVFTKATWKLVKDCLVSESKILNLGRHIIDDQYLRPVKLFELIPNDLKDRDYPTLFVKEQVEPGYKEAPSTSDEAIVLYAETCKPALVKNYEERKDVEGLSNTEMSNVINAYYESLNMLISIVPNRLNKYKGYLCSISESGNLTLAFSNLPLAVQWACHFQAELLKVKWPKQILNLEECKEQWHNGQILLHKGLRVMIGMAHGKGLEKRLLNTGNADYEGPIASIASKVVSLAHPGQVLIHTCTPMDDVQWIKKDTGVMNFAQSLTESIDGVKEFSIEISRIGVVLARETNEPLSLYQAQPASLACPGRFTRLQSNFKATEDSEEFKKGCQFWNKLWNQRKKKKVSHTIPSLLSRSMFKSKRKCDYFATKLVHSKQGTAINSYSETRVAASIMGRRYTRANALAMDRHSVKRRLSTLKELPSFEEESACSVNSDVEIQRHYSTRSSDSEPIEAPVEKYAEEEKQNLSPQLNASRGEKSSAGEISVHYKVPDVGMESVTHRQGKEQLLECYPLNLPDLNTFTIDDLVSPQEYGQRIASLYRNASCAGSFTNTSLRKRMVENLKPFPSTP